MAALLTNAINVFFKLLEMLILIRVLMSWVPSVRYTGFGNIIYTLTEPVLGPVKRMMDKSPLGGGMMVDFSPVIALFILQIIQIIMLYIVEMF
ncbi:MAG: YggT family protein [Clostridiales bacterium]|nr:YggT family protein [Clostridiales bacterium]